MQDVALIIESCIAAGLYSLLFYVKKRQKQGREDAPFQWKKLGATILVGVVVGYAFAVSGETVSQMSVETRLAGLAGAVALVESTLKIVVRQAQEFESTGRLS